MNVLGIKPSMSNLTPLKGGGRHDAGACLLIDGEIVAAVEEERFTRNKHSLDEFPHHSIRYVLDEGGISLSDIDILGVGRDRSNRREILREEAPQSLIPTSATDLFSLFREVSTQIAVGRGEIANLIDRRIHRGSPGVSPPSTRFSGEYETISHHRCHAASAAYCANSHRPTVLTIDARGEHDSTVLWDHDLRRIRTFSKDNSIGLFYALGVRYLGYQRGWDAGKVMGLASYGQHRDKFQKIFKSLVTVEDGEYDVTSLTKADAPIQLLEEKFDLGRPPTEEYTQRHKDFAFHLQSTTERIVTHLVDHHLSHSNKNDLALAGGVALNCKMNREIADLECVDSLFIQPAANDSGICLGAALEAHKRATGSRPDPVFEHVYLGPSYRTGEIGDILSSSKVQYETIDNPSRRAAKLLSEEALVGWFQGRLEFGPRALGNRSILANPISRTSTEKVNRNVKHREPWRPFAPSILADATEEYLQDGGYLPYMIRLDSVPEEKRGEIPAVVHVDGTTRPQTVSKTTNERFYEVVSEFEELTGTPVILNTSFNISGQPIVESPEQAIRTFYSTGLDALIIDDYLLLK